MSADNGYVLRQNDKNQYVLQYYCASADDFPPMDDPEAEVFDDMLEAVKRYNELDEFMNTEYGLTIRLLEKTKERSDDAAREGH